MRQITIFVFLRFYLTFVCLRYIVYVFILKCSCVSLSDGKGAAIASAPQPSAPFKRSLKQNSTTFLFEKYLQKLCGIHTTNNSCIHKLDAYIKKRILNNFSLCRDMSFSETGGNAFKVSSFNKKYSKLTTLIVWGNGTRAGDGRGSWRWHHR